MHRATQLAFILSFTTVTAIAVDADAREHERVEISELKEKGEVVGLKLKLTLRPSGASAVRIGLGPTTAITGGNDEWRAKGADKSKGWLLHQWAEEKDIPSGKPKEVELTVKYADAPNLKPGEQVSVVTAWNVGYWHLWGAKTPLNSTNASLVTLPKTKEATTSRRMLRAPTSTSARTRTAARASRSATNATRPRPPARPNARAPRGRVARGR
jgi:hypothetical protein